MTDIELLEKYKKELVDTLVDLVKIPSVLDEYNPNSPTPFGKNINDALHYMLDKANKDGFETLNCDNYAGHIDMGGDGTLVGVIGHLDVVPVSTHWTYDPFSATIIDGKMYGRGTGDDKGPTVAAYIAMKMIKDQGIKLKNKVRLILGTDEETGWRGLNYYFNKFPHPEYGFAPDADFPLIYGEKGRMTYDLASSYLTNDDIIVSIKGGERYNVVLDEVEAIVRKDITSEFKEFAADNNLKCEVNKLNDNYSLKLYGTPSHGAWPQGGVNAGTYMCLFLKEYTNNGLIHLVADKFHLGYFLDKFGLAFKDYEMEEITCNIGVMDISNNTSRVTLDLRVPVRYDLNKHNQVFNDTFNEYNVKVTNHTNKDVHYVDPNSKLVKDLYSSYVKYTNDTEHKPFTIGGGTYAGLMKQGVAFGMLFPGDVELAHQDDEYITLESLYKATLIYYDAILKLGEVDA